MTLEKSLKILELPAILEMLAGEAVSESAKSAARELTMSPDYRIVKERQTEVSAAKNMMAVKGSPSLSGLKDVRGAVRRADMGGMLNTTELLDIAGLLRAVSSAVSYSSNDKNQSAAAIDYLFSSLSPNKALEGEISGAIIAPEEIADTASRELSDIRRHMRIASDKVRQALAKIISSQAYAKALQEPIITVKNGRYVVPVKAEQKSAVPGLVHDISSSGATLFIEPMAAVQINNELRELEAKEKQEVERILMALSAEVSEFGEDIVRNFEILTELDLIFAKAKLSYKLNAAEPALSEGTQVRLRGARHPLLAQKEAVPIDIALGGEYDTLVITGPNTGGKTVTLKTLGLLCAMAQCGLHIPANDGSHVPVFSKILADIGDEQSIEQSLSTFSSHMTNIVRILDDRGENALLLFDELGAGTDPVEGAALAVSIIESARGHGTLIAATTHYAELKTYALTSPGVINASCEFDIETLRPTYRLITGIPGKSNAFAIARRLGLPEDVIEDAKGRVGTENAAFEDVLMSIEATRVSLEADKQETGRLLREAQEKNRQAEEYRSTTARERESASQIAKREAGQILSEARKTAEAVMSELSEMRKRAAAETDWQKLNEEKTQLFRRLNESEDVLNAQTEQEIKKPERKIVPGDRVRLIGLGTAADVIEVSAEGVLTLQAGIMKITAREDEVSIIEGEMQPEVKRQLKKSQAKLREMTAKPELDLRGMLTDDAIPVLERFLDSARLAKLETVTIIHGKGTGAMRKAVQQCLKQEKGIKAYRLGRYGEGEDGVTVVTL